jgi:peptidoglycan/xylan/chitin deacetylase (PgdA/CDA1 family)
VFDARKRIAAVLGRPAIVAPVLALRRRVRRPWLTILNYHRIQEPAATGPFDAGVVDATPAAFDSQLRFLRENFNLIDLRMLEAHLKGGPLPANPALVTFDDGYRECHDVVLPLLQRHRVPAAFFIATDYVESRRLFWWDRIAWTVHHATRQRFELAYPAPAEFDRAQGPAPVIARLQRIVKETYDLDLERFLDEAALASGAPWERRTERELADQVVMTWDHVRALREAGMGIGSHTSRHRVLQTLPPAALDDELRGSRLHLEREIGEPVRTLAYPVGRPIDDSPAIRAAVTSAGYEMAFSACTGLQPLDRIDTLGLRRLGTDGDWSLDRFRCAVTFPAFA